MNKQTYARLALFAAVAPALAACGPGERVKETSGETIRGVQLETVRLQQVPDVYQATGTVRSATTSVIAAQISGTVFEMRVNAGDHVRRGQLLAVIDDRTSRAQLAGAQAGVEEATQGLAEIEQALAAAAADRQFAEATFKRYEGLLAKNSVSKQEFEGAESRYKAALAHERALAAKKKQVEARGKQARSHVESAQTLFSHSRVVSPIDGVVTARPVDAGTVVMPGTALVTVEDPGRYRLEAGVAERLVSKVSLGMTVAVDVARGKIEGRVAEIVPAADVDSRTFLVKVDLPRDCGCRSGEYGTASFPIGEEKLLTIPRHAIVRHGQLEGVFVASAQRVLEYRLIKTGKELGERVEVLSGLAEGERVATSHIDRLRDGAQVEAQ